MNMLNNINDVNQASDPLKLQKEKNMSSKYFYLAYYALANIIILYLLQKQYKFSSFNFLSIFLVILILIFGLKYFGIPYV